LKSIASATITPAQARLHPSVKASVDAARDKRATGEKVPALRLQQKCRNLQPDRRAD